jgi:hypothetical protein
VEGLTPTKLLLGGPPLVYDSEHCPAATLFIVCGTAEPLMLCVPQEIV